jgi:L-lactate dehydrogenase (cytochrome)
VGIGRAHLWGLATAGAAGVKQALDLLQAEIDLAMAIGGWNNLRDIDRDCISAVNYPRHRPGT